MLDRCRLSSGMIRSMSSPTALTSSSKGVEKALSLPQIAIAGCCWDAETRCTCEVLRQFVQNKMTVQVEVMYDASYAEERMDHVDYFVTVLTQGILQDKDFAAVLLTFETGRQNEPVDIVTVL